MPRHGRLTEKEFFEYSNWVGYGGPVVLKKDGVVVITNGMTVLALKRDNLPKSFQGHLPMPSKMGAQSEAKDAHKVLYPVVSDWIKKDMEELFEIKLGTGLPLIAGVTKGNGYALLVDDSGFRCAAVNVHTFKAIKSLYIRRVGAIRYYTPRLTAAEYMEKVAPGAAMERRRWLDKPIYISADLELVAITMPYMIGVPTGTADALLDLAMRGRNKTAFPDLDKVTCSKEVD